jgi:hypothetical protein
LILIQGFDPLPEDLNSLWEDYNFMHFCKAIWRYEVVPNERAYTHPEVLSLASSHLIEILRTFALTQHEFESLFELHILLNMSWDDLRAAICPFHMVAGWDALYSYNQRFTISRIFTQ